MWAIALVGGVESFLLLLLFLLQFVCEPLLSKEEVGSLWAYCLIRKRAVCDRLVYFVSGPLFSKLGWQCVGLLLSEWSL